MQSLERLSARSVPIQDSVSGKAFENIEFPREIISMIKEGITFERLYRENLMNEKSNAVYFYEALNNHSKILPWHFIDSEIQPDYDFMLKNELKTEESLQAIAERIRGTRKQASQRIADAIKDIRKFVLLILNNPGHLIGNNNNNDEENYVRPFRFAWFKRDDEIRLIPLFEDQDQDQDYNSIQFYYYYDIDRFIGSIIEIINDYIPNISPIDSIKVYPIDNLPKKTLYGYISFREGLDDTLNYEVDDFRKKLEEEFDAGSILLINNDLYFGSPFIRKNIQIIGMGDNVLFFKPWTSDYLVYKMSIALMMIEITYPFNSKSSYTFIE